MAAVQALIDTSVLIDLWRAKPDALQWLGHHKSTTFGLPVRVCTELIDGVRDNAERRQAIRMLGRYPVVHLTIADSAWARAQHAQYKLSHNIGIIDAFVAAPAARLKVPTYTLNTKHFAPLPGISAQRPY